MPTPPLVSICLPTYNRAALLRESLQNLLAQDYPRFEVIVSDNASDDGTEAVGREAARADARVRYVRQTHNVGLYPNHNFCLDQSRGEMLCFFHDDDLHNPGLLRRYMEFLTAHPEVGVVCSDWELIDETGNCIGVRDHRAPSVMPGRDYITRTIRSGRSCIGCPGAMLRRSALGDIRFDETGCIGFGDFVVWFQVAEHWAVGHLAERLWKYRLHPGSLSRRTIISIARDYHENLNRYCDGYLQRQPAQAAVVRSWRRAIDRYLFWALVYEVGLYYQGNSRVAGASSQHRSVFELMAYHLKPEEFRQALEQLAGYRTGLLEHLMLAAIRALQSFRCTGVLGRIPRYAAPLRGLLGL